MQELKPGDRVRTPQGHNGRVVSVDGKYVVVEEDSGYSWRGRADDCVKMSASVHVPSREEMSMDSDSVSMAGVADFKVGDKIDASRCFVGYDAERFKHATVTKIIGEIMKARASDGVEAAVSPRLCVKMALSLDPVSMATSAACPYCRKAVSMSRATLGEHNALGGACPGSSRAVARVEMGRAVLAEKVLAES
jgi:hypothetical protein